MSPAKVPVKFHTEVYEEASNWLVLHRTGPLNHSDKKAFDAWLRISPERIRAYLDVSALWEEIGKPGSLSDPSETELIARAKKAESSTSFSQSNKVVVDVGDTLDVRAAGLAGVAHIGLPPGLAARIGGLIALLCVLILLVIWWVRA